MAFSFFFSFLEDINIIIEQPPLILPKSSFTNMCWDSRSSPKTKKGQISYIVKKLKHKIIKRISSFVYSTESFLNYCQQVGIVSLERTKLLVIHLVVGLLVGGWHDGIIVGERKNKKCCWVLDSWKQVNQRDVETLLQEAQEQVVEKVLFVHEVEWLPGELISNLFSFENSHLLPQNQIHKSTHQQLWLILDSLNLEGRTIQQLHHHPISSVWIVVIFLKIFGLASWEKRVPLRIAVHLQVCIPLQHYPICPHVESRRI